VSEPSTVAPSLVVPAAGSVPWRRRHGSLEVALVHRPKYDDWSLPKGKSEPGEHILLTAVREVSEETCVRPVLGPRLPTVEYISWGQPKRVSYWSVCGSGHEAAPGNEIDAVAWVPLVQAREQLAAEGVAVEERDATRNQEWKAELLGYTNNRGIVPTIVRGERDVQVGFPPGRG